MAGKVKNALTHAKSYDKVNAPKFPRGGDTLEFDDIHVDQFVFGRRLP